LRKEPGFPVIRLKRSEPEPTASPKGGRRYMNKHISKDIAAVAEEYAQKLRETREILRGECAKEEFDRYADGIAQVLEHLEGDILAPIYKEHPDLRPSG
jgi:hypothetical protein